MARRPKAAPPADESHELVVSREPIESTWRGFARFACPFCPVDAIEDEPRIRAHIADEHPEPVKESTDGETDTHEDNGSGAESDSGRGGHDDRGEHDG